jgi:hypothetical protein
VNIVFLKHICDCLGCDRVVHGVVDEVSGLNSITKPFSDDLMKNRLFVLRKKLKRMASFAIFLVLIHFLLNPFNVRLS